MKDFAEAYKAWKYQGAKRAGWAEPGKRTQENHAILIPRREAVDMADIMLACTAIGYVAEFAADKCRFIPLLGGGQK